MAGKEKPLERIGSSFKDLMALSPDVRRRFGYALSLAQMGDQDDAAKVLRGFTGAAAVYSGSIADSCERGWFESPSGPVQKLS